MSEKVEAECRDTKLCPRCSSNLPVSEFGVSRARKDGRNIYCKRCNRERTNTSRQAARDRRSRQKEIRSTSVASRRMMSCEEQPHAVVSEILPDGSVTRSIMSLSPVERVRAAVGRGPKTQKQLLEETRLSKDEMGEVLADLLLWTHEVGTRVIDDVRIYFLRELRFRGIEGNTNAMCATEPAFDAGSDSTFSSLSFLMPGKEGSSQEQKNSAWVAV
jgi:hypothetical protein